MELEDIVMKLVGPILAVGETNEDARRLDNLKELTELIDRLLVQVANASVDATRQESSMRAIGQYAKSFVDSLR